MGPLGVHTALKSPGLAADGPHATLRCRCCGRRCRPAPRMPPVMPYMRSGATVVQSAAPCTHNTLPVHGRGGCVLCGPQQVCRVWTVAGRAAVAPLPPGRPRCRRRSPAPRPRPLRAEWAAQDG
eukprot:366006-Chlamydomonas_euryale.AAC.11